MNILLLGGTGRTGKIVIDVAVRRGHTMVTIARDPEKLKDKEIKIIHGTPYDFKCVEEAIDGCHAVINMLDVSRRGNSPWAKLTSPKDLISKSACNTIKAMQNKGIKRFIALSTIGAGQSWQSFPLLLKLIVSVSNLRYAFQDLGRQEQLLERSNLEYTICRAPKLIDKRSDLGYFITTQPIQPLSSRLSRVFAAEFCIELLEKEIYIEQVINISNVADIDKK